MYTKAGPREKNDLHRTKIKYSSYNWSPVILLLLLLYYCYKREPFVSFHTGDLNLVELWRFITLFISSYAVVHLKLGG